MECKCTMCGMEVKGIKCTKCDADLVPDIATDHSGKKIQVAKCPNDCGQIKSPICCGHDMECA